MILLIKWTSASTLPEPFKATFLTLLTLSILEATILLSTGTWDIPCPVSSIKNSSSPSGLKGPVTKVLYKGVWVQIPTGIIRIWYDKAITIYDGIPFCRSFAFLEGSNSNACCKSLTTEIGNFRGLGLALRFQRLDARFCSIQQCSSQSLFRMIETRETISAFRRL